jgi:hypothetical protein
MSITSTGYILEKQTSIATLNDGSLSGYVYDTLMKPIVGALVRVYFHGTHETDVTDSSGYYQVTKIPICYCLKNCTVYKFRFKPAWIILNIYENTTHDFVLTPTNTLYVGGSGPANFSKIQSAINNANDGDTVFVYSGIYKGHLEVDKSINLIGENKNTTIIRCDNQYNCVISIKKDGVNIRGFTIKGVSDGIDILSNNNTLMDNIISTTFYLGVGLTTRKYSDNTTIAYNTFTDNLDGMIIGGYGHNITGNTIYNNQYSGIYISSWGNTYENYGIIVRKNYIYDTSVGIAIYRSENADITGNIIAYNHNTGMSISGANNSNIMGNVFLSNRYQISLSGNTKNTIIQKNNFLKTYNLPIFQGKVRFYNCTDSTWNQNYWNRPRIYPKLIFGWKDRYKIPWINIDWNPASEPYDIGV